MGHSFHIPVLGLAFSIDTPIKVAQFGISSVISIVDDELLERMREYYCKVNNFAYHMIHPKDEDSRARRITAYLNLVNDIVNKQIDRLRTETFKCCEELNKYFTLLPDNAAAKQLFDSYQTETDQARKSNMEENLKNHILAGAIDVNIMSKVDKINKDKDGLPLPQCFSDASAALRGFAMSNLHSSLVISAGLNPKLFSYIADFEQFLPNSNGEFTKKIVLKVSDYRSAFIQAKILVKKGIWTSEFRIESGLNCGGHAFATEGFLLGPILEEFRTKRKDMQQELYDIYAAVLKEKNILLSQAPEIKITVQGGIGTSDEHNFLLQHYQLDRTGWGSPFLLVPEATTVDDQTLTALIQAEEKDFYISSASPLGVPFNNFKNTTAEKIRLERIQRGRPGSPCTKKLLISNTEFTQDPICTASREYQNLKIKELNTLDLPKDEHQEKFDEITAKTCLCEGLASSAYLNYNILKKKERSEVAICPGPNTAYFGHKYSLKEMVNHIYGRENILSKKKRPHMFINELFLYIEYLKKYIQQHQQKIDNQKEKYINNFKNNLLQAIAYYTDLKSLYAKFNTEEQISFNNSLKLATQELNSIDITKIIPVDR